MSRLRCKLRFVFLLCVAATLVAVHHLFWRRQQALAAFADGWLRTGDVGQIGKDGLLRLTGRLKDEINRAGFKVQPAEIDLLLEGHPDVAQACCFGLPDAVSGETVAAAPTTAMFSPMSASRPAVDHGLALGGVQVERRVHGPHRVVEHLVDRARLSIAQAAQQRLEGVRAVGEELDTIGVAPVLAAQGLADAVRRFAQLLGQEVAVRAAISTMSVTLSPMSRPGAPTAPK